MNTVIIQQKKRHLQGLITLEDNFVLYNNDVVSYLIRQDGKLLHLFLVCSQMGNEIIFHTMGDISKCKSFKLGEIKLIQPNFELIGNLSRPKSLLMGFLKAQINLNNRIRKFK